MSLGSLCESVRCVHDTYVWLHSGVCVCVDVLPCPEGEAYWSDFSQPLISLLWLQLNRSQLRTEAARICGSDNDTDVEIRPINPGKSLCDCYWCCLVCVFMLLSHRFGPCWRWTQGGQRSLCDPQEARWDQSAAGERRSSAVSSVCEEMLV